MKPATKKTTRKPDAKIVNKPSTQGTGGKPVCGAPDV
jgi:hypothetical protein